MSVVLRGDDHFSIGWCSPSAPAFTLQAFIGGTAAAAPPPSGLATLPSVGAVP